MQSKTEVTVDRMEFKKAVSWTGRGRKADREETRLYADGHGFVVKTALAETRVKSVGEWKKPVVVNSGVLKRLAGKLAGKELTLLFFDGRLVVGSTKIPARDG